MATYDIDALKSDLPTAKELAQFVYDRTQIALDLVGKPKEDQYQVCLLYTSPSPRDKRQSRMPSSA